jgi:hypothetical protein
MSLMIEAEALLKRRSTSTRLHGEGSQKAVRSFSPRENLVSRTDMSNHTVVPKSPFSYLPVIIASYHSVISPFHFKRIQFIALMVEAVRISETSVCCSTNR